LRVYYSCRWRKESPKFANLLFPILNKGKKDKDYWDEIRDKLTSTGEQIYEVIMKSDL
jgi:hypothetical protein